MTDSEKTSMPRVKKAEPNWPIGDLTAAQVNKNSAISWDRRFADALQHVSHLLESVEGGDALPQEFASAGETLAGIPLTTEEYGVSSLRLANAVNYLEQGELGAARYELRILIGMLRRLR